MRLTNKVAIITGSSRGIGKAIALAFAREGARIVVAARTEQVKDPRLPGTIHNTLQQLQALGADAIVVRCDISTEEEVERMMQETLKAFGQVDILVNNAALLVPTPILQLPFKHWNVMMKVNMNGMFLCTKAVLPHMVERKRGNILNITSDVPRMTATGGAIGYGVTKAAMNHFTQSLAVQMKEHNIAVNSMNPGPIKTEGAMFAMPNNDWTGWHDPAFVGPPAVFLASQDAHGVTGQIVNAEEFGKTWGLNH
ncbi:MAG: SDR family oxidoreductase [Deltaproteobacteria bacterium]|nr:SDR family oxidoreductase [Deltaproteobacteria bacterium]